MLAVSSMNYSNCVTKRKYMEYKNPIILTTTKKRKYSHIPTPKRKLQNQPSVKNPKKQKNRHIHCIVHFEKYICDIYECCGIKHGYQQEIHMPYIN